MYKSIIIEPVAKPRMTQRDRWEVRPRVLKYRQYCDRLRMFKLDVDWESLDITFYFPFPPSWSESKKKHMHLTPHRQRPDIDNLCKAFMDALLKKDSTVWKINAKKLWAREGKIIVKCKTLFM